jgi:hypothetical protein
MSYLLTVSGVLSYFIRHSQKSDSDAKSLSFLNSSIKTNILKMGPAGSIYKIIFKKKNLSLLQDLEWCSAGI